MVAYRLVWHAEVVALCAILRRRGTAAAKELAADLESVDDESLSKGGSAFRYVPNAAHERPLTAALVELRNPDRDLFTIREGAAA
jgi:hypothetical protein